MPQVTADVWDKALATLREVVGEDEFNAWLMPIAFREYEDNDNLVTLSVASEFYQRWISRKYLEPIKAAISDALGNEVQVEVIVSTPQAEEDPMAPSPAVERSPASLRGITGEAPRVVRQHGRAMGEDADDKTPMPERLRLSPRYTFDDFVVGESNRYSHAAAQSVADPDSQAFNPLFIYGPSGLGKTHLMQAIGHTYLRKRRNANVLYVTSEQFINAFIESIQSKRSLDFRNQYRSVDLLLLDDVQFLMGKERTQQEVFHTFNTLFDEGKKIVLTSDRPPKDLSTLEERLRSRFEWGVIADIQPPDLETRIAILRQKARAENLSLPMDVIAYIAEWVKSNIRELEGALKRIKVYASLHNCPINLEVAREVLSHLIVGQPQSRVTIEDIQRNVCEYFEISSQQLLGANRSKKFSQPRHLALYLCRELTDLSFPDIAQKFGGKDHTSVIYAYRKIKAAAENDPNMSSIITYLTKQIEKGQSD